MSDQTDALNQVKWPALVAALIVAGAVSLSIHVVMLQVLGIPFPEDQPPVWAKVMNLAGTTSALIAFQVNARAKLGGFWRTVVISGPILLLLKEGIRGAIMNGVVTTGWGFALAGVLVPLLLSFGIALICATSSRWVRSPLTLLAAGLLTGALAYVLQALVGVAISPVMGALAHLARPDVYHLPYPLAVLIPAYLTFAEPLVGCGLLVALVWDRIEGGLAARLAQLTLLVLFLKGVVVRTLVFPAYMEQPYFQGMLSQSQFLLEFAALAILTALAWNRFGANRRLASSG